MNNICIEQCLYKKHVKDGELLRTLSEWTHYDAVKIILNFLDVRLLLQRGQKIDIVVALFMPRYTINNYGLHRFLKTKNTQLLKTKNTQLLCHKYDNQIVHATIDNITKINLKKRVILGNFSISCVNMDVCKCIGMINIDYVKINDIYLSEYF